MALLESHKKLFHDECSRLMLVILGNIQKLDKNPTDLDTIESVVNLADVVRGDAKFLEYVELEQTAKMIVELFTGMKDIRKRQREFDAVKEHFGRLEKTFFLSLG